MGNYKELKAAVSSVIKTNGNQEITGAIMQNALLSIISTVGGNATFAGIATPDTNPGTPDQNVFYLAAQPGIYSNFGGAELTDQILVFSNKNGNWAKADSGIATSAKVAELENKTQYINFEKDAYNVGDAILELKFYTNRKDITLQKFSTSQKEIKFYEWDNAGANSKIYTLSTSNSTSNNGDVYTWDLDDVYIQVDFSKSDKTFGTTTRLANEVLGVAFFASKNDAKIADYEEVKPYIGLKNAYLYQVISSNDSRTPSLLNGILNIPSQNILTEGYGAFTVENTNIVLNNVLSYNYGVIVFDKALNTISVKSLGNIAECTIKKDLFFVGIVSKSGNYLSINSKFWKVNNTIYTSEMSEQRIKDIEDDITGIETQVGQIEQMISNTDSSMYIKFESEQYDVSKAIVKLAFYSNFENITLQKVSSTELIFYKWNEDFSQSTSAITLNKTNATSNNGDIYTWDNDDYLLIYDFSKSDKSFGNTTLINNIVLGNAFFYSKKQNARIADYEEVKPYIGLKNAYLYQVNSATNSKIPSFKDNIITIPAQNIITEGHSFTALPLTTIDVSTALSFNYGAILFDKKLNQVFVKNLSSITDLTVAKNLFFLGLVSKTDSTYFVMNSRYWKNNDIVYSSEISEERLEKIESDIQELFENQVPISDEELKIVMGKHLYCIDGEPLPIYKSSLVVSNKVAKLCLIQKNQEWERFSEFNFKFPKYNYFEDALYFDATYSPQTLSLAVVKGTEDVMYAVRGIQLHHVSKESINGKTIKYLPYGASNTSFGFGRVVAEYLKLLGCTVQTIGVLKQGGNIGNDLSFPCYGEGRGGWGYMTYIGKKPYNQGSWITYPPAEQEAGTFTGTMNPFMKPATEDDKTNHAEYCFPDYTHAGQDGAGEYEVWSLQEIRDKGLDEASYGQFYIYDFQWYLDNRPVEAPDVMTIQLGLNDSPAIEASQFALPWILGSITTAVPNCKIGICPSPAVQQTASGDDYVNNYSSYNNWLNTYLEELGNTNVTVLNLAVSMNRQFDFAFNSVSGEYISDDGNLTEKVNVTDNDAYGGILHSDNNGFMEIGKCIGAFIANNLVE